MTSFNEGSPQFIKEAMVCGCPIVSTDVGDVSEIISQIEGCYLCSYDPCDVSQKIEKALSFNRRTIGRQRIIDLELDSETIAGEIYEVYKKVLKITN
jgi:teichuronic acid biosynthesis glycosyltransferase TuaC